MSDVPVVPHSVAFSTKHQLEEEEFGGKPPRGFKFETVKKGENLWTIAAAAAKAEGEKKPTDPDVYKVWKQIEKMNPALTTAADDTFKGSPMGNPNLIYPGEPVVVPTNTGPRKSVPHAPSSVWTTEAKLPTTGVRSKNGRYTLTSKLVDNERYLELIDDKNNVIWRVAYRHRDGAAYIGKRYIWIAFPLGQGKHQLIPLDDLQRDYTTFGKQNYPLAKKHEGFLIRSGNGFVVSNG
jgi:hypothetical protein